MKLGVGVSSFVDSCCFAHPSTFISNSNNLFRVNLSLSLHFPTNPNPNPKSKNEVLVVVGGGPAGIYGAIWAKTIAPNLNILAENYPRGHKELRGSFFSMHSPADTMSWFTHHGVKLKTESDGRVFPVSNSSSSVIDCLMNEIKQKGVSMQTGKSVSTAATNAAGKFFLKLEKRNSDSTDLMEADYLLLATGSSMQGYSLAGQFGHSIVDPVPSLFTFKIKDPGLAVLSGVGPMLVTHWGVSGPVILRLSAWSARNLYGSSYKGTLIVDFAPDLNNEKVKSILLNHKKLFAKQKVVNSSPTEFGLVKRFWKYLLNREGFADDVLWASISSNALFGIASLLKQCVFEVTGKGQFKDEFVTAGGVPLSEISLNTMESKLHSNLFFAGEILNIDGVTGGFNFQ
ncbi:hypothetical protein KSS87_021541, partial [Heliosperma pusillum]